jgi:protein TonB
MNLAALALISVLACAGLLTGQASDANSHAQPEPPPTALPEGTVKRSCGFCGLEQPSYPPEAKAKGIQGTVHLKMLLGTDGRVKNVQVIDGDPLLAPAAVRAVQKWTYKPYRKNGKLVEVETTASVNFTISHSK